MNATAMISPFPMGRLSTWGVEPLTESELLRVRAGEGIRYWVGYVAGYAAGAVVHAVLIEKVCRKVVKIC